MEFTLVKMTCHHLFLLCFNFFSHCNSLGKYRGNISVGKIPRKFTDGNIPSVFPFVFIDFLVVNIDENQVGEREKNKRTYTPHDRHSTTCTADLWKGRRDTLEVALESRFWSPDCVARVVRRWLTLLTRFFFNFFIYQITLLLYEHPITTKWPHVNDKKKTPSQRQLFLIFKDNKVTC